MVKNNLLFLILYFYIYIESSISIRAQNTFRKRSSTFVTYQVQPRIESESYFTVKRIDSKQNQLCQECLRRENLLQNEHENFLRIEKENKKLSEQIRSLNLANQQYQEENSRLKQYLTKRNFHLRENQINFGLFKQKTIAEKNHQTKQEIEDTQLRILRHEIQVYQQVITEKRREKQKEIDYFYHFRNK